MFFDVLVYLYVVNIDQDLRMGTPVLQVPCMFQIYIDPKDYRSPQ